MVGSKTSSVKTTCRKLCPANVLLVSNLICDLCFKVHLGSYIEKAFYLPYYCFVYFEPFFVIRLPPWEINAASVLFPAKYNFTLSILKVRWYSQPDPKKGFLSGFLDNFKQEMKKNQEMKVTILNLPLSRNLQRLIYCKFF